MDNKQNRRTNKELLHFAQSNKNVKSGFTLAEVLITLGIIGVVAAFSAGTNRY